MPNAQKRTANDNDADAGDNLPAFGLPMLSDDREVFEPTVADDLELYKEGIKLLKELDGFSLKGDTTMYSKIMQHMANMCWRHTKGMGMKEGIKEDDIEVLGISLSTLEKDGPKPNIDAWQLLRVKFLNQVEACGTECGVDFKAVIESPTLASTMPRCYRAGILMATGMAKICVFKKSPRPSIGVQAEPDGTKFDARKHVLAPAARYYQLRPEVVFKDSKAKDGKGEIRNKNMDTWYTYMSAEKAVTLHNWMFGTSNSSNSVGRDKDGFIKQNPVKKGPTTPNAAKTKGKETVEVVLGEGFQPGDVWQAMKAMTSEMSTGEIEIPLETQQDAVRTVQEMVDNLDKKGVEALAGPLGDLQSSIESQCEMAGTAPNIFLQAVERLEDIPNIFKLSDDERVPLMTLFKTIETQVKEAASN